MPEAPHHDTITQASSTPGAGPPAGGGSDPARSWRFWVLTAVLALVYGGSAFLPHWLGGGDTPAPFRLADGLALAVLWRYGRRLWPGIWLGAFAVLAYRFQVCLPHVAWPGRLAAAGLCAVAAAGAAVFGSWLLSRWVKGGGLDRSPTDAFSFAILGAFLSTAIVPGVLLPVLWWGGGAGHPSWLLWLSVWAAGVVSVLLVTPLLVVPPSRVTAGKVERLLLYLSLIVAAHFLFGSFGPSGGTHYAVPYLLVVWPMWAAIRTDLWGTTLTLAILMVMSTLGSIRGLGPLAYGHSLAALLVFQGYMIFVTFPIQAVAGAVVAYRHAMATWRESELRLSAILDHSPSQIFLKDLLGRYILVNRRFEEMNGYGRQDVLGRTDLDLFPLEAARQFRSNDCHVLASGKPLETEETLKMADGLHTFLAIKFPLVDEDGVPYAVCGIVTDITERKVAEARQHQIVALQQADMLKNDFLAVLSHELRTPLTVIIGFGSLLLKDLAGPLTDLQRQYLDKILASARQLLRLVNDVLDMGRILAGRFTVNVQPAAFSALAAETVTDLQLLAANKQITLANEIPTDLPPVCIDEQRIRQVLSNLIENAVKFTPAGGTVRIRARRTASGVICEVIDNGKGIPADQQPLLFHPFTQLDMSARRHVGGVGLGLSISREIILAHEGRIGVDSQPGRGSTFWFTMPAAGNLPTMSAAA